MKKRKTAKRQPEVETESPKLPTLLTPENAPRVKAHLVQAAPFTLRVLAAKLGAFGTAEGAMAWHMLTSRSAQVDYVYALLLGYDAGVQAQRRRIIEAVDIFLQKVLEG